MPKHRNQENTYGGCTVAGSFLPLAKVDLQQIQSMLKLALGDLTAAKELVKITSKESAGWNVIYRIHYDVLHAVAEAYIHFDKIKARTHECLFAYLCVKHPQLELDWNFFDKVRTKRNGSMYYGESATYQDWKGIELQINLYIKTLKKAIEEKIK
jgi:hypothetical protein